MKFLAATFFLIFSGSCVLAQIDTSYVVGDTMLVTKYYYRNGQVKMLDQEIKGRDMYSYNFSYLYYKNGNPKYCTYYDTHIDTDYYVAGRRNGSIELETTYARNHFTDTKQNRKGEVVEISHGFRSDTFYIEEKYKHGKLISSTAKPYLGRTSEIDTIVHYQGTVGDNSGVVITQKDGVTQYNVNGKIMTEAEYNSYQAEYDKYISSRQPKHFYKEYTADSILIYEGDYVGVDLPCGIYREYFPNGTVKVRGFYNSKGERTSVWSYYYETGILYNTESYTNGKLDKKK
jgi:antitoxin component YwqK of YwqJK toxin-antitoxin module